MAKRTIVWLLTAASLILVGGILFTGVMMALGWDFSKLSTAKYETNEYAVTQEFKNISIRTITADVEIYSAEDGKTSVVCYEQEKMKHTVEVVDGTLYINVIDTRGLADNIAINFQQPRIKVYLPEEKYGDISIKATTGDIEISNGISFGNIDVSLTTGDIFCAGSAEGTINLKATTGDIRLEDVRAWNAILRFTTGDVYMSNVVLSGNLDLWGRTGDVRTFECDAKDIYIKLTTGDAGCHFLTPKAVDAHTTTGKVDYLPGIAGDPCIIETTTGNITVSYS